MPPDLVSFIEKLPEDKSTFKLEWQSLSIDMKYSQLKSRFSFLEHYKLLALALLLQHLPLATFTDQEILAIADLPLQLISITNTPVTINKTLSTVKPLFDSASSRVYNFINTKNIADNSKLQMAAGYLNFNNSNLEEIITKLYTGGF